MATKKKNLSQVDHSSLPNAVDFRIAIITSEWNSEVTSALQQGCMRILKKAGVKPRNLKLLEVPGTFELPAATGMLLAAHGSNEYDAIICIGCVIQGETRHFDFICSAVATSLAHLGAANAMPVIFGVLTTNTMEQALARAGGKHGNKGVEAAATALQMIALAKKLGSTA
ncbi:MAG: 6,7-dimethyl-8-ribityllumazine synthase [Bacteroidetes bacterium]|nr:6,7-dimethyl-8-ribityllumazine synthase [Bacteroidota bacterium]